MVNKDKTPATASDFERKQELKAKVIKERSFKMTSAVAEQKKNS